MDRWGRWLFWFLYLFSRTDKMQLETWIIYPFALGISCVVSVLTELEWKRTLTGDLTCTKPLSRFGLIDKFLVISLSVKHVKRTWRNVQRHVISAFTISSSDRFYLLISNELCLVKKAAERMLGMKCLF
jgi:hypothetical protein